uniref:CRAL/TRIO domain-containing protein n=1 Tax=Toxoplasma gondii (strain ATCC 50861 / VEG) TaxID=432359 RepID=A0A0F7UQK8_TOXGV|nr:TPA: CRAL/TRIO domain-containing protein [Toxoplasma gondii VEG]
MSAATSPSGLPEQPATVHADDFREVPERATDAAASSSSASSSSSSSTSEPRRQFAPGETALLQSRQLAHSHHAEELTNYTFPPMTEEELDNFGWQWCLDVVTAPSPHCIPVEALTHKATAEETFKVFFKGTPKEVCIRQIFFHMPLSEDEQLWLSDFRALCAEKKWIIPYFLEPHLLRVLWFCKRKYPDDPLNKSLEHAQQMVEWRREFYPLSDKDPELAELLKLGAMYWVGRDPSLRPLLIVRLSRLPKATTPELFKKLTIFCFEWALRFLMVPGVVETCVVLFDVRAVPLHQFPVSALTDMVNTLTKQFPFRLHRMWIINDSFFVQTVWSIAKQFLTEVQQQKMKTGFEVELLKDYAAHQLEKHYGGSRDEIRVFYPFPLAPGPFNIDAERPRETLPAELPMLAVDRFTTFGVVWEGACRLPIQWSAECSHVFAACGIPAPPPAASLEDAEAAEALAAEAAGQAVRSQTIKAYKSMVSLRKKPSVFSLLRRQGCSLAPAGEAPRPADDGHECEQEETTTEEKTEKERVEPAAVVEKEVGRGTEKAGEQEGEKEETNGQAETQQLLGAAEAPGLVGEEISRRLSKPAEAMQGSEDNAQNSEEEKPQAHAERKTERAGDGKEAEKTRHDAASAEAEAAQVTSQENPGGPPESKNSTRASPTAAPVEKVKSKKCCGACKIQ